MSMEIIVGCYTPGAYATVAEEHLIRSLKALNSSRGRDNTLEYQVEEIPSRGSWVLNNSACQLFLQRVDQQWPEADFIYCDVDAVIHWDPWPFMRRLRGKCDIAAYWLDGNELLSGTLYLPAGPKRAELLTEWIRRNNEQPNRWDQKNLQDIHEEGLPFKFANLPPEYCCIFDLQRRKDRTPNIYPVIEHFQASRRFRNAR